MNSIVECVPNFSEGRNKKTVDLIIEAMLDVEDVFLIDREMDADHNRCVITLVGTKENIGEAAVRGVVAASKLIDLNTHQGEHPRMGAADVVPFIPVKNVTMEECAQIARWTAQKIWERCKVPTYLYENAAARPDRKNLAVVRRGQFEGLREEVKTNLDRLPDFGKAQLHESAGATAVGARQFLVAYNINLDTPDIELASKIADSVRFIGGGLRFVKAMGFKMDKRNIAQVSMNLTDFEKTPVHRVFNMVKSEAERYGVQVVGSEIVGLIPQKALDMAADFFLRVENFSSDTILENRLANILEKTSAQATLADDCKSFLGKVASKSPTPGGGSVSALGISLGASLGLMVIGLTRGRKKYLEYEEKLAAIQTRLEELQAKAARAIDEDSDAYAQVMAAYKMSHKNAEEKERAIQDATRRAADVPLEAALCGVEVMNRLHELEKKSNPNAASDLKVGAYMCVAGIRGALANVRINLTDITDKKYVKKINAQARALEKELGL
jgi:glutamate formiminotransferase / formiminotetrahydrofolate cyclodeaminase